MLTIEEITKELGEDVLKLEENIAYTYQRIVERYAIRHFGKLPYMNQLTDKRQRCNEFIDNMVNTLGTYTIPIYDEDCDEEELREKRQGIDMDKTLTKIVEVYPEAIIYSCSDDKISNSVIFHDDFIFYGGVFYMATKEIPQKMLDCIVEKEDKAKIRWVLKSARGGIQTKYMNIEPKGEIEGNYNEDFYPIDKKINDIIRTDESSIIILHGKPGTGKTSYIRNLINENKDIMFYWLDSSMFSCIDTSEFVEYITSCKNAVFILEDSESLLTSRDETHNPAMQSLLSISDGMLGDSLKLKFICTFNTDLKNIDKAILRKGRMKVKYEFKDLEKEKVEEIFKEMGIDPSNAKSMPLCDVYNYLDDNGHKEKQSNKIGFN